MWDHYSKKIRDILHHPQYEGKLFAKEGFFLAIGTEKILEQEITLYWLVDEEDGVIADVKFEVFGSTLLTVTLEAASALTLRKNYDQASRISAGLLEGYLSPFPKEGAPYLNATLSAIDNAVKQCQHIPFGSEYEVTPIAFEEKEEVTLPHWQELSLQDKLVVLEEVISKEIRPYIELDAGGVEVVDILNDWEVVIAYQGACTSCYSAMGSTLGAIQEILKKRIHFQIFVTPKF